METLVRIALGFKGLNGATLSTFADTIYNSCNGNTNFTGIAGYVGSLNTQNATLKAAVIAEKPGDKASTSAKHDAERAVKRELRIIAATVEYEANNNETIALSSGFSLKAKKTTIVKGFSVKQGLYSGTVDAENVSGGIANIFEYTTDPIGSSTWIQAKVTTQSKTTITGLTPAIKYWFRGAQVSKDGQQPWSDPFFVLVV